MKNIDFKKLLVFIIIIAIVIFLIFFGFKTISKDSKIPTEEQDKINNVMEEYFTKLTEGFVSTYNGVDILYTNDKTTVDTLEPNSMLNTAIKYASENDLDINVSIKDLEAIEATGEYGDIKDYTAYNGAGIREAIKRLFGKDIDSISVISDYDFLYDFYYVDGYDIYLMKRNDVYDMTSNLQNIEYKIVETKKDKGKVETTIAVAYTYKKGDKTIYYSDNVGSKEVSSASNGFPEDKIKDLDKYKFTMTMDSTGNYIFQSVEKVK